MLRRIQNYIYFYWVLTNISKFAALDMKTRAEIPIRSFFSFAYSFTDAFPKDFLDDFSGYDTDLALKHRN